MSFASVMDCWSDMVRQQASTSMWISADKFHVISNRFNNTGCVVMIPTKHMAAIQFHFKLLTLHVALQYPALNNLVSLNIKPSSTTFANQSPNSTSMLINRAEEAHELVEYVVEACHFRFTATMQLL